MRNRTPYPQGVSLVICTYNGARLLKDTIPYILAQKVPAHIRWEMLFIDNASTDETQEVISSLWEGGIPMRIIREETKGLIHARYRGIAEARYEFISFIDDDNWIEENWIRAVYDAFIRYPEAGMLGSNNSGVYQTVPPEWFPKVLSAFAIGQLAKVTGDITISKGQVWGAGMSFRKSAFEELTDAGFRSILTGRKGKNLGAGEDTELAMAFVLAGWQLWYVDEMKLQHFIPSGRMNWGYVRRMFKGFGQSRAIFNIYKGIINGQNPNLLIYYAEIIRQFMPRLLWKVRHITESSYGQPKELEYLLHRTKLIFSLKLFFRYGRIARGILKVKNNLEKAKTI